MTGSREVVAGRHLPNKLKRLWDADPGDCVDDGVGVPGDCVEQDDGVLATREQDEGEPGRVLRLRRLDYAPRFINQLCWSALEQWGGPENVKIVCRHGTMWGVTGAVDRNALRFQHNTRPGRAFVAALRPADCTLEREGGLP